MKASSCMSVVYLCHFLTTKTFIKLLPPFPNADFRFVSIFHDIWFLSLFFFGVNCLMTLSLTKCIYSRYYIKECLQSTVGIITTNECPNTLRETRLNITSSTINFTWHGGALKPGPKGKKWQLTQQPPLLGTFAKLRKTIISFVMSVCPSVRMELLGSHCADFCEIWYLRFFWKSVEKIQVSLKSDTNKGHLIWRPIHIFDHISLSLSTSQNEKCFTKML